MLRIRSIVLRFPRIKIKNLIFSRKFLNFAIFILFSDKSARKFQFSIFSDTQFYNSAQLNGGQDKPGTINNILAMVALFVIAMGTGGIKPCVSALGGDQFSGRDFEIKK